MEISEIEIENSCGVNSSNATYIDPGNDPNFVFVNDPTYESITLYDIDGNIINVNSWIECVHYLKGGWVGNQNLNFEGDQYLAIGLIIFSIISTGLIIYLNKKNNEVN
tara:strand:+ start:3687 stop:4010 length:324 start_codon:yes stop_codon:yes gene_type:complete